MKPISINWIAIRGVLFVPVFVSGIYCSVRVSTYLANRASKLSDFAKGIAHEEIYEIQNQQCPWEDKENPEEANEVLLSCLRTISSGKDSDVLRGDVKFLLESLVSSDLERLNELIVRAHRLQTSERIQVLESQITPALRDAPLTVGFIVFLVTLILWLGVGIMEHLERETNDE